MLPGSHTLLAGSHLVAPLMIREYTRVSFLPQKKLRYDLGASGYLDGFNHISLMYLDPVSRGHEGILIRY